MASKQVRYEYIYGPQEPPRRDPQAATQPQIQYLYAVPTNPPPAPAPTPAPAPAPPKILYSYYPQNVPPFLPPSPQPPSRPDPPQTIIVPGPPANTYGACPCQAAHSRYPDKPTCGDGFIPGDLYRVVAVEDKTKVHSAPPPFGSDYGYGDRRGATHRVVHDPHASYYGY